METKLTIQDLINVANSPTIFKLLDGETQNKLVHIVAAAVTENVNVIANKQEKEAEISNFRLR